jgi:hypothetical protein
MNPHVACKFCELEKHLLALCRTAVGEVLHIGEATAENDRML